MKAEPFCSDRGGCVVLAFRQTDKRSNTDDKAPAAAIWLACSIASPIFADVLAPMGYAIQYFGERPRLTRTSHPSDARDVRYH